MRNLPINDGAFKHDAPPAAKKKLSNMLLTLALGHSDDIITASDYADCSMIAAAYMVPSKLRDDTVQLMHTGRERLAMTQKVRNAINTMRRFDIGLDTDKGPVRDALDFMEKQLAGKPIMQGEDGARYAGMVVRLRMLVGRDTNKENKNAGQS